MIDCRTPALGWEVYASDTEEKRCYHTCKSRFCPSCGYRATLLWLEEQEADLPEIGYAGMVLTMPRSLWLIFQQNRHLLHDLPALGAGVIQDWVRLRYGVRVIILVVAHTFGGDLKFNCHLHILVSSGGLQESEGRWIPRLDFNKGALMRMWRYAVITHLRAALEAQILKSDLNSQKLKEILKDAYERHPYWITHLDKVVSKSHFARYAARYISPAYPGVRNVPLTAVTGAGAVKFGLSGTGTGPLAALTPGIISTVAGNGTAGETGNGGAATSAELNAPNRMAVDSAGNLYIADYSGNVIRKVTASTGLISTVAGNGTSGYSGDGSAATSAEISSPNGVAVDAAGNIYIADSGNNRIRKVTVATGIISTVAGNGTGGYSGDGGAATSAKIWNPVHVTLDRSGNIFIADYNNNRIREVTVATGIITTVAGNGTRADAGDGGAATSAELNAPVAVAIDAYGNFYIAEYNGSRIRKVTGGTGIITTVVGNGTALVSPASAHWRTCRKAHRFGNPSRTDF
jgi:Transposase zinc-binding domain/Putative transposase/NHL repeat